MSIHATVHRNRFLSASAVFHPTVAFPSPNPVSTFFLTPLILSALFFVSGSLGGVQRRATLLEFYWIAATAFIKLDVAN